ncbi:MAG: histidinol dehydrogenase, partial [Kineosporiaceae bacterium]|nr:histidinol dehydrogenase [Aeromicrobium sp.]
MRFSPAILNSLEGSFHHLKAGSTTPSAQRDPQVIETVTRMLADINARGMAAVVEYSRKLDGWQGGDIELPAKEVAASGARLPKDLRTAIELGAKRTQDFARETRSHLTGFETEPVPGVITGVRYVPVSRVGAYLPAGRFPLTASGFMTVGVAKAAGVPNVIACTPPQQSGGANDAVVYTAHVSGVDRVFVLGGVQALAAMAFGLVDDLPVDMLVGAGNAYVAEAKRQLFGQTAI